MKKLMRVLAIALCLVLMLSVFASCKKPDTELKTVRLCVHSNEGAALTAIGLEQGIFEKHGIDVDLTIVDAGPPEMAAMRADNRTLDIGYIGSGVAWNAIEKSGNELSFLFLDYLGNSENLLAKKGIFTDSNKNGTYDVDEIYNGLKGQKIYFQTGATPGQYFKNLLEVLNEGKSADKQLWYTCEVSDYMTGYTAPNSDPAYRIEVVNYENSMIAAGMSTQDASGVQIAIAYSPVTTTILSSNKNVEFICAYDVLPASKASVGSWVASNKWIEEDPETVQNVVDALLEAACYRTEHIDEAIAAAERLLQKPEGSLNKGVLRSISASEYKEWFANKNATGYEYMRALYENRKVAVPEGSPIKTFEESFNDSYLLNAIKNMK